MHLATNETHVGPRVMPRRRAAIAVGFLICVVVAAAPSAPRAAETGGDAPAPSMARARSQVQQQDWSGAVATLEAVTQAEPDNGQAWALMGFALRSDGKLDRAIEVLRKAIKFEVSAPRAMYNLSLIFAVKGNVDETLHWLAMAKETRAVDMTRILAATELETLSTDPRFRALLPTPEDYAKPFEGKVRIIHEWDGEEANDQFGWIARNIGDVDGDGIDDLTTSAPTKTVEGQPAGRIYVYSGKTGRQLWAFTGVANGQLGTGIEAAGDTNADGIPDVIAGAPAIDKAYVFSGRDGKLLMSIEGAQGGEAFGRRVSDVGDWNRDGHADVLVGAPLNDEKGTDAGRAAVYSGKDGSVLWKHYGERAGDQYGSAGAGFADSKQKLLVVGAAAAGKSHGGRTYVYSARSKKPKFVIEADETGVSLGGMFVSVVGDVDADGVRDVYASDWSNRAKGRSTGRIFIHSGKTGRRLMTLTGEAAGDGFGIGPADAGDVDGDGHADLIIGAWQHGSGAPSGGKSYLYSGKTGSLMKSYTGRVDGETFGFDATGMGDVDGDGSIDFLITSAWSAIHGYRSGRMYIISGDID